MLLGGKDVTQADSHHGAAAQFCLSKVSSPRGIDSFDDLAVEIVDLVFFTSDKAKTDHRHHHRRREFEAFIGFDPIDEQIRQTHLVA